MSWISWGGVTLRRRLLVIVWSLHLVILVFKECLEHLQGGVTLHCRLLVIVQLLCLVILVCSALFELLLFLLFEVMFLFMRFVWLVVMVSMAVAWNAKGVLLKEKFCYFPTVWWSLFCLVFCAFVAGKRVALCWVILIDWLIDWLIFLFLNHINVITIAMPLIYYNNKRRKTNKAFHSACLLFSSSITR